MWVWHVPKVRLRCFLDMVVIGFFDQNVGIIMGLKLDTDVHGKSLVLLYLIKMWAWHVPKLD